MGSHRAAKDKKLPQDGVQHGALGQSWTSFLPQTHQVYSSIWNHFRRNLADQLFYISKPGKSHIKEGRTGIPWWSGGYDLVLPLPGPWVQSLVGGLRSHKLCIEAKTKREGKAETQCHHKPHPGMATHHQEGTHKPGASPWGMSPQNAWLWIPMGLRPRVP